MDIVANFRTRDSISTLELERVCSLVSNIFSKQRVLSGVITFKSEFFKTKMMHLFTHDRILKAAIEGRPLRGNFRRRCRGTFITASRAADFDDPVGNWKSYFGKALDKEYRRLKSGEKIEARVIEWVESSLTFASVTNLEVFRPKLILNPNVPFIAVAPDGVIFFKLKPIALLEIKSVSGLKSFRELSRPPFVFKKGKITCHHRSKTFLQVQLSLLVANLRYCILVVHLPDSLSEHKNLSTCITIDKKYVIPKVKNLESVFRTQVLPYLETRIDLMNEDPYD